MTPSLTTPRVIDLDDLESFEAMLSTQNERAAEMSKPIDEAKAFVAACTECERVCFETANHCLTEGGTLSDVRGVQLLRNCARICRTSAAAWSVGSGLYSQVLRAAAQLCGECATACERLASDQQLKTCAQMCRDCAESCERMAQIPLGAGGTLAKSA
jgi:hypothetical protein